MADAKAGVTRTLHPRPMSPHLTIYRLTLTMAMSIVHRITGAALVAGTLLLAWWLLALSTDAGAYETVSRVMTSVIGQVVLLGYTWALLHHMLGGIRHFIWDMGYALEHPGREMLVWATFVGGIALTIIVWVIAYVVR